VTNYAARIRDQLKAAALFKAINLGEVADVPTSRYNLRVPMLASAQAVATANVASRSGAPTFDGVTPAAGDIVLLTAQTTGSQNGPWVTAAGAWTRPPDYPAAGSVKGRCIEVNAGTLYSGTLWVLATTTTVTIDTTATTWKQANSGTFAPLASPALTGSPTAPTQSVGDNTTKLASTAFVQAQMAALLGGPSPAWPASTAVTAYTLYQLPTGGLGYVTAARTTRASFDATERATWVFIPGRHFEQILSGTTWTCPTGIAQARFRLRGGGGGGGGGGSAATGIAQVGGGGGGAGASLDVDSAVTATTVYTLAIGAGGVGGTAGAAGGNAGGNGGNGGDTTLVIGATTYTARGGGRGAGSGAGATAATTGGHFGNAGGGSTVAGVPGQGGASAAVAIAMDNVSGGSGGGTATTTLGGNNGNARTAPGGAVPTPSGNSGTSSGVAGTSATELGCGGGGGGGGTNNTGAGGAGGAGVAGQIKVWF
jgi:hypothetical protein